MKQQLSGGCASAYPKDGPHLLLGYHEQMVAPWRAQAHAMDG